jgi:PIN domain nuclease of toxin-antitoxin system
MNENAILLDTHIWIWLSLGVDRLANTRGLEAIEKAKRDGRIHLSIISIWEVGMLVAKGRLQIQQSVQDWIRNAMAIGGFRLEPISLGSAVECTRLPGQFHPDPADQILVATARELDVPIVTADSRILAYAKSGHVKAIGV